MATLTRAFVGPVLELIAVRGLVAIGAPFMGFLEFEPSNRSFRLEEFDPGRPLQEHLVAHKAGYRSVPTFQRICEPFMQRNIDQRRRKLFSTMAPGATALDRLGSTRFEATFMNVKVAVPALGFDSDQGDVRLSGAIPGRQGAQTGTQHGVTGRAFDLAMPTGQGHLAGGMFLGTVCSRLPALDGMARLTGAAIGTGVELSAVEVLVAVQATIPGRPKLDLLSSGDLRMALSTINPSVLALQRIFGIFMLLHRVGRRREAVLVVTGGAIDLATCQSRCTVVGVLVTIATSLERRLLAPAPDRIVTAGAFDL